MALEWILDDGRYLCGEYEARPYGDVWRLFLRGKFIFSAQQPAEIIRYVHARNGK